MKKRIALFLIVIIVLVSVMGCTPKESKPAAGDKVFLNIATGGTAGTYFPLGGAFAEIWTNNIPGMNATAQSTGASTANINLLFDKKIEVAMVQNDIAWYSANGKAMFEGEEFSKLRGLTTLYNEPIQMITTDPTIKSLADIKGKRVSVGAIGSGNEANARQILKAAGYDIDKDIQARFLPYAETVAGMQDNQIDVALFTTGVPNAGIQELGTQRKVIVVPIDAEVAESLLAEYPFFTELIIPANSYKDQTEDVKTITVKAMLAVSADMTEDLAYQLTKQIYENPERVSAAHTIGKLVVPETALEGMSIPLHPGSEKYFKEIGIIK